MWDDAAEYGERYYRQGSQAVRNTDNTTVSGLLIAGAIGYGIAWLLHGQRSYSSDDWQLPRSRHHQSGRSANRER